MDRLFCSCLSLLAALTVSCNCSKSRPRPSPVNVQSVSLGDAGAAPWASATFECAPIAQAEPLILGATGGVDEDDDSGVDVPFAINVGPGLGFEHGFAVTAIDGHGGRNQAVLALNNSETQSHRIVNLGRTYGDADPPRIVGNAERLVLAMADMDAAVRTLSLLSVSSPFSQPKITRGPEVSVVHNPSTVFSLALSGQQGVLVWDQTDGVTELSQIALVPFSLQTLALQGKPQIMSAMRADADSPNIIARPAGYWLAWVQPLDATTTASHSVSKTASPKQHPEAAPDDNLKLIDMGQRVLHVMSLDAHGHANGKPIRVSEGSSHVVAYDLALLDDGAALFAWRDDDSAPGIESQIVRLARVGSDGHVENFRIEDESIGVGAPQLLMDPTAPSDSRVWLAIINTGDKTSMAKLGADGRPTGVVVGDANLGVASPVARYNGQLLVVRQRGRGVDVESLRCRLNALGARPAPSSSGHSINPPVNEQPSDEEIN